MKLTDLDSARIAVVGLGYVGLPLAVAFGREFDTVGFDIKSDRVRALREGRDATREVTAEELAGAERLSFTDRVEDLAECNVFIVTVPTPIDGFKKPDLRPLISASEAIGRVVKRGDVVIYESTVYPGATEEDCVPVIERVSGLKYNQDFFAGYSPERINPGDREHRVHTIMKVTSGSTPEVADFVDALYRRVITAGTHKASSIRVAEAAKVIENTQRDVNIALVNELAVLFERLGIDTEEVLLAAGTKWNFLPFRPGLVGGHCIGVDPYYLTHKAQAVGHNPEMILAGRRLNDHMGQYVAAQVIKLMAHRGRSVVGADILVLGLTFKENTPDIRNTRVVDIIHELRDYTARVDVHDPNVDPNEAAHEYGLELIGELEPGRYDAVILAVGHDQYRELGASGVRRLLKPGGVLYDIKYVFPKDGVDGRL
jgi:UDP-N-acetyl-D-galactosamine dehydrogenase